MPRSSAFWCRRWGVAEQDIVDVLQEVFSAVASHLEGFRKERPSDTFRGWLLTIARNKTRDYFRRRGDEPAARAGPRPRCDCSRSLDPHVDEAICPSAEDDAIIDGILGQALETIRGEFHERTWQAFWGVVVEGRAVADVAADLDMRPGTVRVAKSRVLLRLRNELGDIA